VALTDKEIRNIKPGTKRIRLFDERALYLEVSPAGGKWWRLKYRHGGKEKRLSLGVYPDVGLKAARDRRDAARRLLGEGIEPAANKKALSLARAEGNSHGFKVVALEWHTKFSPGWAEGHAVRIGRVLERDIYPWIEAGCGNCGARVACRHPANRSPRRARYCSSGARQLLLGVPLRSGNRTMHERPFTQPPRRSASV
jgi:hypothetical protein